MYLKARGIDVRDYFDPDIVAVLDMEHRSAVNYELYFFGNSQSKARFDKDILKHCGVVTDPIIRTRFRPSHLSPHEDYMGRRYYFLTHGTQAEFAAHPDSFAVRQGM
ncbi:MAG TPA: hypothetical protein VF720_03370 [Candidatus Eisenbacteria bacterium]